ncbi:uroporphyrinogen-III synthase [Prochlorococcus marinus]|uniref:uroporphyrinogen-III synthase n=1 Tax=Prochlorococcus marinus TaxID=1219 RepID=UPI001ADCE352|nr:uroporphyrinogen-III synthase [Prochlorococcus marinus]MBO8203680.1 uroporphyrinogen-III synthase [Prochlorococcus marinus CUG1415]MBW3044835.1 uroporphyrinogen-III synthase [Prochlorococcus marinus str. MU1415]
MPIVDLPLDQRNIIITRSKEGILDIKKIFTKKGANIYDFPAISIGDPDDLNPLDEALNQINDFHWIIFSSSNGIKFVDKRLRYFNSSLKVCSKKTKIAVVGEKTAKTLEDLGIKADFIPPEYVAESLIDNFPISGYGLRVFLPRVQTGGRDLIADEFRKAGSRVLEVAAYETRCPESIPEKTINVISNRKVDAFIFSSGKTVSNSAFLLEKEFGKEWLKYLDQTRLLTIGPQTTKICQKFFGRVDSQAEKYTFEGLLDVAINILR